MTLDNMTLDSVTKLKKDMERIIAEALIVEVDSEGNWEITDSSVRNAVDDLLSNYDIVGETKHIHVWIPRGEANGHQCAGCRSVVPF